MDKLAYSLTLVCSTSLERARTGVAQPAPGNHDYMGVGPSGYFAYYGAVAGTPQASYYSYNLGAWHIIALDDNCDSVPGGCAAGAICAPATWGGSPRVQGVRVRGGLAEVRCLCHF
jgi:hypothetical protein